MTDLKRQPRERLQMKKIQDTLNSAGCCRKVCSVLSPVGCCRGSWALIRMKCLRAQGIPQWAALILRYGNPGISFSGLFFISWKEEKRNINVLILTDGLKPTAEWFCQLWAESPENRDQARHNSSPAQQNQHSPSFSYGCKGSEWRLSYG